MRDPGGTMTSRRSTYAVRALVRLALMWPEPQLGSSIATAEGIPKRFLDAILRPLSREGVLEARRGRNGGYALRTSPAQIEISTVVRIVDGPLLGFRCMDPIFPSRCAECPGEAPCAAQLVLSEMLNAS